MSKYSLTVSGKTFIRKACGSGDSNIKGKNSYILPYCYPPILPSYEWISNPDINGGITSNDELAENLIKWYNEYGDEFSLDANIIAAQTYAESKYIIWNYSPTGALGLTQFLIGTIFDTIISNRFGGHFSDEERIAITKNIDGYTFHSTGEQIKDPFATGKINGKKNRKQLHQNIIDNPKIMLKAQFVYMNYTSGLGDDMASCALFGYNRGPDYIKGSSYTNTINDCIKRTNGGYENEGINYVYKIFKLLYENFGDKYKELDITKNHAINFDGFNATKA